jgi:hypothetical protein
MGFCSERAALADEADERNDDDGSCCIPCCWRTPPVAPPVVTARLRVRVLLWQDRTVEIEGAMVSVDHGPAVATVDHGDGIYADFGQLPLGVHQVRVVRAHPDPLVLMPRVGLPDLTYIARMQVWGPNLQADLLQDVHVDQCVRLKVGHATPVTGADTGDQSWGRCWLPAIVGYGGAFGYLMWFGVDVDAGALDDHGASPANPAVPAPASEALAPGAAGWRYFRLHGPAAANVTIDLCEQGFAREADDPASSPIIPWNFYFWSASRSMTGTGAIGVYEVSGIVPVAFLRALDADNGNIEFVTPDRHHHPIANPHGISPFERFDTHFGLDPAASAMAWEQSPLHLTHNDLLGMPNPATWIGHCNMMCAASIVFDEPVNTAEFDAEELKLFAAEFAANTVITQNVWALPDDVVRVAPVTAAPDPADPQWRTIRKAATASQLGAAALGMLEALRHYLGQRGFPLLTDMRAAYNQNNVRGTADEVWNQVVFKYFISYQEQVNPVPHATEERQAQDLRLNLTLYANADGGLPTMHLPAQAVNGDVVPNNDHTCWKRTLDLRLQFTNAGQPGADPLNTCTSCVNVGPECFLPRYLAPVETVTAAIGEGEGNPHVTLDRLQDDDLNLVFRQRYQPPFHENLP